MTNWCLSLIKDKAVYELWENLAFSDVLVTFCNMRITIFYLGIFIIIPIIYSWNCTQGNRFWHLTHHLLIPAKINVWASSDSEILILCLILGWISLNTSISRLDFAAMTLLWCMLLYNMAMGWQGGHGQAGIPYQWLCAPSDTRNSNQYDLNANDGHFK